MHECQNRAHEATRRARAHDRHVSRGRHRARGDFDRGAAGAASSSEKAETALRRRAVDLQAGVRTTGTWPGPRLVPRPGPGAPGSGLGRARPGPRPGHRPRRPDPDWPRVRGKALRPGPRKRGTSAGARPEPGPRRPGPGPARVRGSAMGLGPGPSQGPGQGRSPGPVRARAPADESWCLGGPGPGPAPRDAASRRLPQYGILPGAGHHGCEAGHRQVPPGAWVQPGAGHRELHLLRALAGAVPMKGRQWSVMAPVLAVGGSDVESKCRRGATLPSKRWVLCEFSGASHQGRHRSHDFSERQGPALRHVRSVWPSLPCREVA